MSRLAGRALRQAALAGVLLASGSPGWGEPPPRTRRFVLPESGLSLDRPARRGTFLDVVGRRSAFFGHEGGGLEVWAYPLKVLEDLRLRFRLARYPLEIPADEIAAWISVRPEATILTYSHAAFTVRQILLAPVDESGVVMLLDVESALPMRITVSFRPRLKLMWPAGLMTPDVSWDEAAHRYALTEESKRFAAVIGAPTAEDVSLMPYQEEPRDVPVRFVVDLGRQAIERALVPIVVAGSVSGLDQAKARYERLLGSAESLYRKNVEHYRALARRTLGLSTPDPRLNTAFAWAKVGMDKGLVASPLLGEGLVAGYRTSGESERPGFGWFFGRDALWTALALDAEGDFATARKALDFLASHQRADGKIPHEVSQSATLLPWFRSYPYPWNAADATPLYLIGRRDLWRASGDGSDLVAAWPSIVRAYRFTAGTDTDGNALVENTRFGHGWVEGGDLHPAHEEIYLQGIWVEACRAMAEMAAARGEAGLAAEAAARGERTRHAVEATYWLEGPGYYAFATRRPGGEPKRAQEGPNREARQARLDALATARIVDEDTVMPAVPLLWRVLDPVRAQTEIDHLGAAAIAADWGARLLSDESALYDPLSYHHGSVWPLFTGWASLAAYRHGRPLVGYQALMANALLTEPDALGYVTELLSGEFDASFGRSSRHQVWSEAMVVLPVVRGLLGLEREDAGRTLRFAPALPASWDRVELGPVSAGGARYDLGLRREPGRLTIRLARRPSEEGSGPGVARLRLAPAFPQDAAVRSATVNGATASVETESEGDVQRAVVEVDDPGAVTEVAFAVEGGTEVDLPVAAPRPGAVSRGLRVLHARADAESLDLLLEGRGGRSYRLPVRTTRRLGEVPGVTIEREEGGDPRLVVSFAGPPDRYLRRELRIPLR